jgi:hypothetical protein
MNDVKINKTRMTLTGNVDLNKVESVLSGAFPDVQVKFWTRKGKTGKQVPKTSPDETK